MTSSIVGTRKSVYFRKCLIPLVAGIWFSLAVVPVVAAAESGPCSANSASRQLDFWLGEWTVTYPGSTTPSVSKVSLDLDKCLIVESWAGGNNHSGKNFFAYSADDQAWHGMFADNDGRVHTFEGKVAPGSAEFYGPSRSPEGQSILNRIKILRVSAQKVEQTWDKSVDNGTTWTNVFKGEYFGKSQ